MANVLPVICRSEAFVLFECNVKVDAGMVPYYFTTLFRTYFAEPVASSRRGSRRRFVRRMPVGNTVCRSQCKLPFRW